MGARHFCFTSRKTACACGKEGCVIWACGVVASFGILRHDLVVEWDDLVYDAKTSTHQRVSRRLHRQAKVVSGNFSHLCSPGKHKYCCTVQIFSTILKVKYLCET